MRTQYFASEETGFDKQNKTPQNKIQNRQIVCRVKPPWRNGLACWTSNSKVVGSSPTGGGIFGFASYGLFLLTQLN